MLPVNSAPKPYLKAFNFEWDGKPHAKNLLFVENDQLKLDLVNGSEDIIVPTTLVPKEVPNFMYSQGGGFRIRTTKHNVFGLPKDSVREIALGNSLYMVCDIVHVRLISYKGLIFKILCCFGILKYTKKIALFNVDVNFVKDLEGFVFTTLDEEISQVSNPSHPVFASTNPMFTLPKELVNDNDTNNDDIPELKERTETKEYVEFVDQAGVLEKQITSLREELPYMGSELGEFVGQDKTGLNKSDIEYVEEYERGMQLITEKTNELLRLQKEIYDMQMEMRNETIKNKSVFVKGDNEKHVWVKRDIVNEELKKKHKLEAEFKEFFDSEIKKCGAEIKDGITYFKTFQVITDEVEGKVEIPRIISVMKHESKKE